MSKRWPARSPKVRAVSRASKSRSTASPKPAPASPWDKLRRHYYGLVNIPDLRIDWIKTAVPAGRRLIEEWRPDIIFASAPPFTGLVLAGRLSRTFGIPWVADFRDPMVEVDPYTGQEYPSEPDLRKMRAWIGRWAAGFSWSFQGAGLLVLTMRNLAQLSSVASVFVAKSGDWDPRRPGLLFPFS